MGKSIADKKIMVVGIDLSKRHFSVCGMDEKGNIVHKKSYDREGLVEFMILINPCLVGMEACGGAHHFARIFKRLGHDIRLIAPQFVKPFVKSNKNDSLDAEAICEAVQRPSMRFVPIKSVEQQDLQRGGRTDLLLTSDEHAPYQTAIARAYGKDVAQPKKPGPGRPPKPKREMPKDLCYATIRKTRKKRRVVEVKRTVVFGTIELLVLWLARSIVSLFINTSFVERLNATDRGQNARKTRKSYRFSKDWGTHNAMTHFVSYSYNFCWPVRTLRIQDRGKRRARTPAMAAGLTNHVWTVREWISFPALPVRST